MWKVCSVFMEQQTKTNLSHSLQFAEILSRTGRHSPVSIYAQLTKEFYIFMSLNWDMLFMSLLSMALFMYMKA